MELKAVEKASLVEQTQARILDAIRRDKLKAGDSLPRELELTQALEVSRPVVREALSRLRMLGLLESKKKRGLVIAEPDVFGGCSQVIDPSFLTDETQRHLFEMRLMLELGLADMLFLRKTGDDIQALRAIAVREKTAKTRKSLIQLDIDFHATLYQATRNPLLFRFQSLLEPFFELASKAEVKTRGKRVTHADLVDELENGSAESFRQAMRKHLDPHMPSPPQSANSFCS